MTKFILGFIIALALVGGLWWLYNSPEEISTANGTPPPAASNPAPSAAPGEPVYPDDYVLETNEVPAQFRLAPIDEETLAMGVTGNPGYITDPQFIQFAIGENVDIGTVDKVYMVGYILPGAELGEVGLYVVRFKSEAALQSQIAKLPPSQGNNLEYYQRGRILVIVWSAQPTYASQRAAIGTAMTGRLGMTSVGK